MPYDRGSRYRSGVRAPPDEAGLVVLEPGGVGGALVVEQPPELFGFEVVDKREPEQQRCAQLLGLGLGGPGSPAGARPRPTGGGRRMQLMWGSVTSLVSAVAVVSAPPVVWVPVIVLCSGLIHAAVGRVRAGVSDGVPPPGTNSRR